MLDIKLSLEKLPKHVGLILDGNRRWARQRNLDPNLGHLEGYKNLRERLFDFFDAGIRYVTVYALSLENARKRTPDELKYMVTAIRNIEKALGNGVKKPSQSEKKNITIVRKSIVAAKEIQEGEQFTGENITVKRPAEGISPMEWDRVIGKRAKKKFMEDECIEL